jgi:tetratricopeptide (TPR) repeat protein
MSKLMLNMIVKNEQHCILRCLDSIRPYISSFCIVDTGSSDLTEEIICDALPDIPGEIHRVPFENFEQARNAALKAARDSNIQWDYLLLADADMELVVEDKHVFDNLNGIGYDIEQRAGSLRYMNRRLIARRVTGWYRGVTHEYLDIPSAGALKGVHFIDHAEGSSRHKKYERDIRLLEDALKKEPANARYWFYLGQSYRDAGRPAAAYAAYKKRVELGGWDEEVWNAKVNLAHCRESLGDESGFVRNLLDAYNFRPSRAEPLYDLAKHFRHKGENANAVLFAEHGLGIPRTNDSLFVNDYVYNCGLREEVSIAGFYVPRLTSLAFHICDDLALSSEAYPSAREGARQNLFYYLPKLKDVAPSFWEHKISAKIDGRGYVPMNPSITYHGDYIYGILRTVNYTITPEGRYAILGPDDTINDSNPINTRNYLLRFGPEMQVEVVKEIFAPHDWPDQPKYKLVTGFEDMRLFSWRGSLWVSSTVRELNEEGYCEQVLARITAEGASCRLDGWSVMRHEPRVYEKNWMPWSSGDGLKFVYRLGEIVDIYGTTIAKLPNIYDVGHMSGGSQVIPFYTSFITLVHEARIHPHTGQRYYQHRFVQLDSSGTVAAISPPFVFQDKQIEFAAGLTWDGDMIRMSYGIRDCEAWVGSISPQDVERLLQWRNVK